MNNYFLTKEDLEILINMSGIRSLTYFKKSLFLEKWDTMFFNEILKNQPSLTEDYKKFKEVVTFSATNLRANEVFPEIFKNKIDVNSLKEVMFANFFRADNKLRGDLYKKIYQSYPQFLSLMDEAIQKDNGTKDFLYDPYFQIMKSKETDKSKYTNEVILQNIKKYRTSIDLASAKKKISAYVSLFDKNKHLYDFIVEDMGLIFKESPSINNYWEEKLQKFPQEVRKSYLESKDSINLVSTKVQYMYTFSLNPKWIVEKHKISDTASRDFVQVFHIALYDVLESKLKITSEGDLNTEIKFIANNLEQLDKLKDFCNKITNKIPDIVAEFNFKAKRYDERKKIQTKIENLFFYQSLDDKLEEKTNKNIKVKI